MESDMKKRQSDAERAAKDAWESLEKAAPMEFALWMAADDLDEQTGGIFGLLAEIDKWLPEFRSRWESTVNQRNATGDRQEEMKLTSAVSSAIENLEEKAEEAGMAFSIATSKLEEKAEANLQAAAPNEFRAWRDAMSALRKVENVQAD